MSWAGSLPDPSLCRLWATVGSGHGPRFRGGGGFRRVAKGTGARQSQHQQINKA